MYVTPPYGVSDNIIESFTTIRYSPRLWWKLASRGPTVCARSSPMGGYGYPIYLYLYLYLYLCLSISTSKIIHIYNTPFWYSPSSGAARSDGGGARRGSRRPHPIYLYLYLYLYRCLYIFFNYTCI